VFCLLLPNNISGSH